MFRKILVALDGSKTAESILPYVRAFAQIFKLPVELLSVIDLIDIARTVSAAEGLFLEVITKEVEQARREYLDDVAKSFSTGKVECHIVEGNPETTIIDSAEREPETLVAMASHGRSGLNRWLLGSVAEKVSRVARNPLLLVRSTQAAQADGQAAVDSIMVPLDGSAHAEMVLPWAAEFAEALKVGLTLFRAYSVPPAFYDVGGGFAIYRGRLLAQIENEVEYYLEEKRHGLIKAGIANVTIASMEGFAADEIIAYARAVPRRLIAMCSHGRSGVRRWALGSVAETVLRHTDNPLLIFHGAS